MKFKTREAVVAISETTKAAEKSGKKPSMVKDCIRTSMPQSIADVVRKSITNPAMPKLKMERGSARRRKIGRMKEPIVSKVPSKSRIAISPLNVNRVT